MRRRPSRASRRLTIAAVAVAVGGGLAFGRYVSGLPDPAAAGAPWPVVVAAFELERGRVLSGSDLRFTTVPAAFVIPGALPDPSAAVGRTLLAPLAEGEPLTETRLGRAGGGPVGAIVPEGLRAFAVTSNLPAGSLRPGDRVDVLATFAGGQPHTETLIEGAEVLLVLGEAPAGSAGVTSIEAPIEQGGPSVLLLVSPEDAESLAYARAFADLTLVVAPSE